MSLELLDHSVEVPDSKAVPRELSRPPFLVALAKRVHDATIAYDAIVPFLLSQPLEDGLDGLVGEHHLRQSLALATEEESPGMIVLDPIPSEDPTSHYLFRKNRKNNLVALDRKGNEFAEYDAITRLHLPEHAEGTGLTVVWEIKTGGRRANGSSNPMLRSALRDTSVDKKLGPIHDRFPHDELGIVIVGLTGSVRRDSGLLQNYLDRGGIYVALPTPRERFQANIAAAASPQRSAS
jgi:hypothetical protein